MSLIEIRDASEADVGAILRIYNDVLQSSAAIWRDVPETLDERLAWFHQKRADGYPVLVAVDATGTVVGFTAFGPFRNWPGYHLTVEHTIHVHAGARGAGVGRMLLGALIERARDAGKVAMIGGVDGGNEGSLRFHARLGFREVGRMPGIGRKFGEPVDLVLVQRDIPC